MNSKKYIKYLIEEAEEAYKIGEDVPFPSVVTLKTNVKKYNIQELKELAKQENYTFTEMTNAPKPLDLFPESYKQERYVLYKVI